jgi:hypothetical protein
MREETLTGVAGFSAGMWVLYLRLGQSPESAGNGDYARIGFRYYSANYAAIIPIIPPSFKKGEAFF